MVISTRPKFWQNPCWLLVLAISLSSGLWWAYPQEIVASDPFVYSHNAFLLSQLEPQWANNAYSAVFSHRLAVIAPVALLYKTCGVSILSTNLWPLGAALLIYCGVYAALPTRLSKLFGICFCFSSVLMFRHTVELYPDLICAALLLVSTVFLNRRARVARPVMLWWSYPLLAVLFLFLAFLAKETACWAIPMWIYTLVTDIRKHDRRLIMRFYLPALGIGLVLGIAYLFFCNAIWHDPWARFKSVEEVSGQHLWSMENTSLVAWLKRLTVGPAWMFVRDFGGIAILAALGAWFVPKRSRFWLYYTALMVLCYWFGSASLSSYQPLPLNPRMALPALPGLLILASLFAAQLTIVAGRTGWISRPLAALIIISATSIPFVWFVSKWPKIETPETNAMKVLQAELASRPEENFLLVCSDARSPETLAFHFGFKYPSNLRVLSAADFLASPNEPADEYYVFLDPERSKFIKQRYGTASFDTLINALALPAIYEQGNVRLLKASDPATLRAGLATGNLPAD